MLRSQSRGPDRIVKTYEKTLFSQWQLVHGTVPGANPWTGSRNEAMRTFAVSGFQPEGASGAPVVVGPQTVHGIGEQVRSCPSIFQIEESRDSNFFDWQAAKQ